MKSDENSKSKNVSKSFAEEDRRTWQGPDKKFKSSKKSLKEKIPIIDSFAMNKNEFIFPIRLFYGYNFDYKDDFVIMGAMMKIKDKDSYNWLCDEIGNTIGFSENLFDFFKNHYKGFSKHDSYLLNLFCLMPDLKYLFENLTENTKQNLLNQSATLILPEKLKEILVYLSAIHKEENDIKRNNEKSFFRNR